MFATLAATGALADKAENGVRPVKVSLHADPDTDGRDGLRPSTRAAARLISARCDRLPRLRTGLRGFVQVLIDVLAKRADLLLRTLIAGIEPAFGLWPEQYSGQKPGSKDEKNDRRPHQ